MRLDRGTNGGFLESALWGKPSAGETRSSALWGKGGRGLLAIAVLALALTAPVGASGASRHYAYTTPDLLASAQASPSATFDVIIQGSRDKSTAAIASMVKSEVSRNAGRANGIKRRFSSVNGVAANLTGAQIVRLAQKNGIAAITTDTTIQLAGTLSNKQRWPFVSGVQKFWANGTSAATPTIAIVDSGIDAFRADFGGRVVASVNLSSLANNSPGDGRGHGTFVAGIAAGSGDGYAGAAPASKIVSLDVMDDQGMAMTRDVIAAADWILANKDKYGIRVANFSLHSSQTNSFMYDPLDQAVERLWTAGVVVVTAAGNYGVDGQPSGVPFAPGSDPFVITVGADDIDGSVSTTDDLAAPWSAYGYTLDGFAKPDVAAPGRYMAGPVPATSTLVAEKPASVVAPGYIQLSGTSFSAPIVSGAAAQILATHPTWTPDQVKGALMVTASRTPTAAPLSEGVGVVDVAKAVALTSAPNPNLALDKFLVTDPLSGGKVFDSASWASTASANASWASASWASASWASDSQSAASWASASWASASWSDNAEVEAPSENGEYLSDAELAQFAADLGLTDTASTTQP
jgi:serine protease AprX